MAAAAASPPATEETEPVLQFNTSGVQVLKQFLEQLTATGVVVSIAELTNLLKLRVNLETFLQTVAARKAAQDK